MKSDNIILNAKWHPYLLTAVVLLSRLPFIFDGHGHEEDSYGLVVNAYEMHSTGHYVASRFPGHPFQEYIYLLIWNQSAWIWNLLSSIFSVVAVLAFYRALKKTGMSFAMEASLMLAFTPLFFIAGTYTIDYAWSLAFVLLSFAALVSGKFTWCGVLLGIAIGCRITSGIFLIPWAMFLFQRMDIKTWFGWMMKIAIPCGLIGICMYIPAYLQYGTTFFDYSDQFPYPPVTKVIYKASIGVFGILGLAGILIAKFRWLFSADKSVVNPPSIVTPKRLQWVIAAICILHLISYLRLPQKAGYMLPIVPFVIMLVVMYSPLRMIRIVTMIFMLAPFLFGMNITDELRGSGATGASVTFNISGQEISIDAARGPVLAEQEKRRNKMEYVERVCNYLDTTNQNQIVICGWWYNEIIAERFHRPAYNDLIMLYFYQPCAILNEQASFIATIDLDTCRVYYLPEQDLYNDQMFGQSCTNEIAKPFPIR